MTAPTLTPAERLARTADPTLLFADAGLPAPHRFQVAALRNWRRDHMLLWTRQGGKTDTGALLAVHNFLFPSNGHIPTVVIVSRAQRQSNETFRRARRLYGRLPYAPPLKTDSVNVMERADGGRILAYPGSEESVRGLSAVTLAIVDEATLIERELRDAVSPMLSTTAGPIWSMATARGCAGWFYDEWIDPAIDAVKSKVTHSEVAHLLPEYIERERRRMPSWQFQQEYLAEFIDADESMLITPATIDQARREGVIALW